MRRSPRKSTLIAIGSVAVVMFASGLGSATDLVEWSGATREWGTAERTAIPEDRYAMAGGCYALSSAGSYVVRNGDGFSATGAALADAEPFHFQATDLGKYLLFGFAEDFLSASEGALGEVAYAATEGGVGGVSPGQIVGGLAQEQTDAAADTIARSEPNSAAGRGGSIVAAEDPSELGDWTIDLTPDGTFALALEETGQSLAVAPDGTLDLVDGAGSAFGIELTEGCASFPEVQVNVDGPLLGGQTPFQEVRGYLEGHLHMMAYEFIGGRVRCGRPWHKFGVTHALVDCPDHEPGGIGAVLEGILSNKSPDGRHNTDGWPNFTGWPKPGSLTHEQVYYKWLERAWRGGQRLVVNLLVDNGQLCQAYPFKKNSCNEMDGVRLQAQRMHELERYIDAQNGGPGEGWFRIVEDPFEAREVINQGKLAVVMGIEVSVPLNCGLTMDEPNCDEQKIVDGLDEVYNLGVRQMELVNKFDNAFSGVTGDSGETGIVVNTGNFGETKRFWQLETCHDHEEHDKQQPNFSDDAGTGPLTGRDAIFGGILAVSGASGAAPLYPEGPHCNVLGLSPLGETMIREMAERGMIFDPDHMSARARAQALDLIEGKLQRDGQTLPGIEVNGQPYSGVFSSHSWADDTIYERVYKLGGTVTPHAGGSAGFAEKYEKHRQWADPRFYFGIGFGSDMNGFSAQGRPRGGSAVVYPFTGLGGVSIDKQVSGTYTYDINGDGVAHYGLYPDWIEDLRAIAGDQIVADLERGAEAYLQMWERAIGIPPDACRVDVPDLTDADFAGLGVGMTTTEVLADLGQPAARLGHDFTYCVGERSASVTFSPEGTLASWSVASP